MNSLSPRAVGLWVALFAFIADQGSKLGLLFGAGFRDMQAGDSIPILPFFNLVMVWNPGISYGLFPASGWIGTAILVAISLAAVLGLGWWLWTSTSPALTVGFGLVIGGALGNLVDRLLYGKVADFFHFYGFGYDWYVFNIADLAITLGAVAIVYDVLKPAAETADDA